LSVKTKVASSWYGIVVFKVVEETANADNRAVFYGYKLLQKDESIYAKDKSKSKHRVAIVLYGA
jgi:hypothetical protein